MIPMHLSPFGNHLWQSTLFSGVVVLLTLLLRKNRAQMRYWLWLAASVKFLIPFSVLVAVGSQFEWRSAPVIAPPLSSAVAQITQPFAPAQMPATPAPASRPKLPPMVLLTLWLGGGAAVLGNWLVRWRRIRVAVRSASPLPIHARVRVMSSPTLLEPGVFGILRPVLLLPADIATRLTPAQFQAILAHELCHVRRRDNLASALHMAVEAIFWFHPLVWWVGARMVEERERACDEEVLQLGSEPQVYAEGILNVCKFYLESPLACASGVTGADLKKRIEGIMTGRMAQSLTLSRKLLLAGAGIVAVAGPLVVGIVHTPRGLAQTAPATGLRFEVASIKPADPSSNSLGLGRTPGNGLKASGVTLKWLVAWAYDIRVDSQISGGPGWIASERYDILAKPDHPEGPADFLQATKAQQEVLWEHLRERTRALLADRFQLVIRRESKEAAVYNLVVAKNGPKLKPTAGEGHGINQLKRGEIIARGAGLDLLASVLARIVGRPVIDKTGLPDKYDFKLEWSEESGGFGFSEKPGIPTGKPEAAMADLAGASIFTAVQDQLGLKLESQKGPVESIVIERAEKPEAN